MKNAMNTKSKPTLDASMRDRLLRVSAKLFATKGYDRVSVREIAKSCKCNVSMISYYFGGKEKLYLAVFENFFSKVNEQILRSLKLHDTSKKMSKAFFVNEIRANIRFFVEEYTSNPHAKIVIHREVMDGFPRARKAFDEHFKIIKTQIFGFYEHAQSSGCVKKNIHIPTLMVLLNRCIESYLIAHMFATPVREMSIDPIKNTDEFINQVEEIFLKGVLS